MRLLLYFFLIYSISFAQKNEYKITKKDGTIYHAKEIIAQTKSLKIKLLNNISEKICYNDIDNVYYEYECKKELIKSTQYFVKTSPRMGSLLYLVADGKCKLYSNSTPGELGPYTIFYAIKNNEEIASVIGAGRHVIYGNLKQRALEFFKDCPTVIDSIKKDYNKTDVLHLVESYNNNCL